MLRKTPLAKHETHQTQNTSNLKGELALSAVFVGTNSLLLKTMAWQKRLSQFRKGIPLFLVHDVGHALRSMPHEEFHIGVRKKSQSRLLENRSGPEKERIKRLLDEYKTLIKRVSDTELAAFVRKQKVGEVFLAGLLVHLFQGFYFQNEGNALSCPEVMNDKLLKELHSNSLTLSQTNQFLEAIQYIVNQRKQLLITVEQVDCSSLRLMELTDAPSQASNYFLELLQVFSMSSAQDIARFSLDLLPSVLETKKSRGSQTYAVDGYASIDNRGDIESLLPTELVYDDDVFERRYLHKEQLFYAREKDHELKERLHYFVVDASASMRGLRTMFARGVALAMAKKALLFGDQVVWRYFDSRLYEKKELALDNMHTPYLLSFRGEKGRNTTAVFTDLHREVKRLSDHPSKEIVISLFSHGRCVIRPEVALGIRNYAQLHGIFVLPSQGHINKERWGHFDGYELIHAEVLEDRTRRQNKALALLEAQKAGPIPVRGH